MLNYLRMPPMLSVLGAFFLVYGILQLLELIRRGYWAGIGRHLIQQIYTNYRMLLLSLLLLLVLIFGLDKQVAQWCSEHYSVGAYTAWDFICSCAEGWFLYGLLLLLILISTIYGKKIAKLYLSIALMASLYAGIANSILKFIFNRQRPAIGLEEWHFFQFFATGANNPASLWYAFNSMPSGHVITTVAALVPLFIALAKTKYRYLLLIWGILVVMARIYTMNHWLSDTVVSIGLGVLIGLACYQANRWRFNQRESEQNNAA